MATRLAPRDKGSVSPRKDWPLNKLAVEHGVNLKSASLFTAAV